MKKAWRRFLRKYKFRRFLPIPIKFYVYFQIKDCKKVINKYRPHIEANILMNNKVLNMILHEEAKL